MQPEEVKTESEALNYVVHTLENNAHYDRYPQVLRDAIDRVRAHVQQQEKISQDKTAREFLNEYSSQIIENCWEHVIDPILHDHFTPEQYVSMMQTRSRITVYVDLD